MPKMFTAKTRVAKCDRSLKTIHLTMVKYTKWNLEGVFVFYYTLAPNDYFKNKITIFIYPKKLQTKSYEIFMYALSSKLQILFGTIRRKIDYLSILII